MISQVAHGRISRGYFRNSRRLRASRTRSAGAHAPHVGRRPPATALPSRRFGTRPANITTTRLRAFAATTLGVLAASLWATVPAQAAPGDLDLSFSGDGFAVARYNADSTLDQPACRRRRPRCPPPTAAYTYSPANPVTGSQVSYDGAATTCPAGPCTYRWRNVGGGDFGAGVTASFTYRFTGTKTVELYVTDALGRTDVESKGIVVRSPAPPPPLPPQAAKCANGIDDDGDGKVDYKSDGTGDPGCVDATDDDESDPPRPGSCNVNSTPTTFTADVAVATAGQFLCLTNGAYGMWTGTNKAITIKAATGASPQMRINLGSGDSNFTLDGMTAMGGSVGGGASNITVKNSSFNTCLNFSGAQTNVVFDHNTHANINATCGNSRIGLGGSGVTIQNSTLTGGDADGVFVYTDDALVRNNRIVDICSGPTDNHIDGLQYADPGDPSGGYNTTVRGNLFSFTGCTSPTGYQQALTSYDSGTRNALIEDNVIVTTRPGGIELYSDQGSIVRHNTVRYYPQGTCVFNTTCGKIELTRKSADPAGTGTQVYDNVAAVAIGSGSTAARNDHNTNPATVSYVGPLSVWAGFALAAGSPGKGAASDGLDTGIRVDPGSPPAR